jgi:hypothetical protein
MTQEELEKHIKSAGEAGKQGDWKFDWRPDFCAIVSLARLGAAVEADFTRYKEALDRIQRMQCANSCPDIAFDALNPIT